MRNVNDGPVVAATDEAAQAPVRAFLAAPSTHGGRTVTLCETHVATVFLAGDEAFKLKKAVRFPFLDFTDPASREKACRREIELNRRTAPELYLGCLPVTRDAGGALRLGGDGEPVDWVVHMRRFDETRTLDRVAADGLSPALAEELAEAVARLHEGAEPARPADAAGEVRRVAMATIAELRETAAALDVAKISRLEALTAAAAARLAPLVARRAGSGAVRRCHGDLHLGNIALVDERPVVFDALEFDERLATIDVLHDLAFLLMDCWERGQAEAANRILNRWLAIRRDPADLEGLALLPLFLSMRAAVRARVAAARVSPERPEALAEAGDYLDAALLFLTPASPALLAVGGLSGSGKSTLAAALARHLPPPPGAVVVRSDLVRKELAGVAEETLLPPESYTAESSERVYAEMRRRCGVVLAAGLSAIADAVHGTAEERAAVAEVAASAGLAFTGVWLVAPDQTLRERVRARRGDASDATVEVLDRQLETLAGPTDWPHVKTGDRGRAVEQILSGLP